MVFAQMPNQNPARAFICLTLYNPRNSWPEEGGLPLKNQVTLGEGAPSASQGIVASLPSRALMFRGGLTSTGDEAAEEREREM